MKILYTLLRDPVSGDLLLFVCDTAAAKAFATWLWRLSETQPVTPFALSSHANLFESKGGCELWIAIHAGAKSTATVQQVDESLSVKWELSPSGCIDRADAIDALAENAEGHQYLEDAGTTTIKVSMNEWTSPIWKDNLRALLGLSTP